MATVSVEISIEQCEAKIDEIDMDGDKKINKSELQMYYNMNGGSLSDEEVDEIFDKAAVDHEHITADELKKLCDSSPVFQGEMFPGSVDG
mmetsp:Transcript_44936/g.61392  ORF Transcript_44936/g.61392 Transcript_44936/m.61392 type:complete len:90 (+) Transcript_44936:56-325(+)|eukprot:CAMPEP_0185756272 /NCGR_PEP_ID=MMETSP1174-20130828/14689_1 /TAXON_ID=35687 /ORGANISM="Dictyocha speculum, Strain CCMP1381" /LENGTH=89 /DNA_ID=CAMNT_0028435151 /DNA_START=48 /DNA_END=317 /DNA_ORIENTATION=-